MIFGSKIMYYLIIHVANLTPGLSSFMTYDPVFNKSITTVVTSGTGTAYYYEAPGVTDWSSWNSCCSMSSYFCVVFYRAFFFL